MPVEINDLSLHKLCMTCAAGDEFFQSIKALCLAKAQKRFAVNKKYIEIDNHEMLVGVRSNLSATRPLSPVEDTYGESWSTPMNCPDLLTYFRIFSNGDIFFCWAQSVVPHPRIHDLRIRYLIVVNNHLSFENAAFGDCLR